MILCTGVGATVVCILDNLCTGLLAGIEGVVHTMSKPWVQIKAQAKAAEAADTTVAAKAAEVAAAVEHLAEAAEQVKASHQSVKDNGGEMGKNQETFTDALA